MKELIRQILKEETGSSSLKNYLLKIFQRQVDSGLIPHIPYEDFRRKKLTKHIEFIDKIYFEFLEEQYGVDGQEKAKTLFHKSVENINQNDLKDVGIRTGQDQFEVEITWMDFFQTLSFNNSVTFGFRLKDALLETNEGLLSLKELSKEKYDDIWVEVTDFLRNQIEDYIQIKCFYFGLNLLYVDSDWDD